MVIIDFFKNFYTILFVWLSGFAAVYVFRRSLIFSYRGFALLIIFLSILETIGNYLAFNGIRNLFLFNIIYTIRSAVVPFFFVTWLQHPGIKRITRFYVFIFPLFAIVNTIWIQGFFTLQTYSFVLGGSFILLLSLAYLWELYTNEEAQNIIRNPPFWISLAYLFYFAVSLPYIGMFNYLWANYPSFTTLYYKLIFDGTICLYNILLTIGLLCMKPATK